MASAAVVDQGNALGALLDTINNDVRHATALSRTPR
jgi:hypothetical protein